jgi:hypothetical protein
MTQDLKIKFSKNWNHKLSNDIFTTIRLQSDYYYKGAQYQVILNDQLLYNAVCIDVVLYSFEGIPDYVLMTDTGYSDPATARDIFKRMYGDKLLKHKLAVITLDQRV